MSNPTISQIQVGNTTYDIVDATSTANISTLQGNVSTLQGNVSTLQNKVGNTTFNNSTLTNATATLQNTIGTTSFSNSTVTNAIAELQKGHRIKLWKVDEAKSQRRIDNKVAGYYTHKLTVTGLNHWTYMWASIYIRCTKNAASLPECTALHIYRTKKETSSSGWNPWATPTITGNSQTTPDKREYFSLHWPRNTGFFNSTVDYPYKASNVYQYVNFYTVTLDNNSTFTLPDNKSERPVIYSNLTLYGVAYNSSVTITGPTDTLGTEGDADTKWNTIGVTLADL